MPAGLPGIFATGEAGDGSVVGVGIGAGEDTGGADSGGSVGSVSVKGGVGASNEGDVGADDSGVGVAEKSADGMVGVTNGAEDSVGGDIGADDSGVGSVDVGVVGLLLELSIYFYIIINSDVLSVGDSLVLCQV